MARLKNTEFSCIGIHWALNDNRHGVSKANYIFFPKYKLLRWMPGECAWLDEGASFDTKKDAVEWIKANAARWM
ncbi:MAG: hypothetical protein J6Y20_07470 [Lachnospiraceae bacterium]|nr:hypothetical protein [Lachnospiraceae bacterium]